MLAETGPLQLRLAATVSTGSIFEFVLTIPYPPAGMQDAFPELGANLMCCDWSWTRWISRQKQPPPVQANPRKAPQCNLVGLYTVCERIFLS